MEERIEVCACSVCSPTRLFDGSCIFCLKPLAGTGTLRSKHGARICTQCVGGAQSALGKAVGGNQ